MRALGPPDLLFFALFLAAAARWNLRVGWTFVALTLSSSSHAGDRRRLGVGRATGAARAGLRVPDPERGSPLARVSALAPRAERAGRIVRLMAQAAQIVGALLILAAYVLAQFRVLDQQSWWYLWLNLVGAAALTVLAWHERQWLLAPRGRLDDRDRVVAWAASGAHCR